MKISSYIILINIMLMTCNATIYAEEWRGLTASGLVVKGGYDIWGQRADYSLLVRFVNETDHAVKIFMHEIYNSTLYVSFVDSKSRKELEAKPGCTGDITPRKLSDSRESIDIGPGVVLTISIGLDGFKRFYPGKFKGYHKMFKIEIPEFEISKNGDVLQGKGP